MLTECPGRPRLQADLLYAANADYDFDLLKNSTFLITGATGLVGSALVRTLLCANRVRGLNARILAPVRSIERAKKVFGGAEERDELVLFEADVTKKLKISEKIDYIVHAASITSSKMFITQPVDTIMVSLLSAESTLSLAKEKNVKGMVYLSSMEAFGIPPSTGDRVLEKELGYIDLQSARSSYSESKRMAECLSYAYAHQYGVPVRAARLAQTFGAGVNDDENRAFMQFAKSALSGQDIVLHTTGESYGNYVYTADCVLAIFLLLTRGEMGEVYTVSNEEACVPIKDLARIASQTLSGSKSKVVFDIPPSNEYGYAPDVKLRLSSQKMRSLGWKPQTGLKDMFLGLAQDLSERQKS
ncbi:MAG: NAD(P)-dependent oxidoreductase [Clostridia bacterium]|nr:NAD(P)-dependent oxidoreductase [Clostridia bacterium]